MASDGYNIKVSQWLPDPNPELSTITSEGIASNLFDTILTLFSSLTKLAAETCEENTSVRKSQVLTSQNEVERLFLWGDGVSAYEGRLDVILSRSSELREDILSILSELGDTITTAFFTAVNGQCSMALIQQKSDTEKLLEKVAFLLQRPEKRESAIWVANESPLLDLEDCLDAIGAFIDCLMDLTVALENPASDPDQGPVEKSRLEFEIFDVHSAALIYCRRIRDRWKSLPKYLVERLGTANMERAEAIRQLSIERDRLVDAIKNDQPDDFQEESLFSRPLPLQGTDTTKSGTKNSIFDKSEEKAAFLEPEDTLSIGTVLTSSTSRSSMGIGKPRIPPMPDQSTFQCVSCPKTLSREQWTRRQWAAHIFRDLRPYLCLVNDCIRGDHKFSSSAAWEYHLRAHQTAPDWMEVPSCPFCGRKSENLGSDFFKHIRKHLLEISLAVVPQNAAPGEDDDSQDSMDSVLDDDDIKSRNMDDSTAPGMPSKGVASSMSSGHSSYRTVVGRRPAHGQWECQYAKHPFTKRYSVETGESALVCGRRYPNIKTLLGHYETDHGPVQTDMQPYTFRCQSCKHNVDLPSRCPECSCQLFESWYFANPLKLSTNSSSEINSLELLSEASPFIVQSKDRTNTAFKQEKKSQKRLLRGALDNANRAVILDNEGNFSDAAQLYREAIDILDMVLSKIALGEDRGMLITIVELYRSRVKDIEVILISGPNEDDMQQ